MSTTVQPAAINPKLIVPFVNSVRNVFATMINVPLTLDRPHVKGARPQTYDVSTIIGFSGEIAGSVVISFQLSAAEKVVESFAGMPFKIDEPDFADALGEIANMIAGAGKRDLGFNASISTPSVIFGSLMKVAQLSDIPTLVIPCKTPAGSFDVEISIKQTKAA